MRPRQDGPTVAGMRALSRRDRPAGRTAPIRWLLGALLCAALAGPLAAPAPATVQSYNEPTYTKTSTNNAFWYQWTAVTGTDENANTRYEWYLCFSTYHMYPNGSQVQEESSSGTNGPGTQNCTGSLRSGPTPSQATYGAMPFNGTSTVLPDGHRYDMCASGYYRWPYLWKWDGYSSCPWTIIDRNKPTSSVSLAGGATYVRTATVPVQIAYGDATSPPWAGSGGVASNWVCVAQTACTPGGQPNEPCSHPADPTSRTTSFSCTANVADGRWYVCAMAADSAVPDNATGPDQFASATSNNANLSTASCDDVTVDRAAPVVTVGATPTAATAGEAVAFSATATDAISGIAGPYDWDFGDGTGASGSGSPVHAYGAPGTYEARVTATDQAGNQGSASVSVTVSAAPGGGPGGGGTPGGGTGGGGTPGGGTPGSGTGGGTSGGGSSGGGTSGGGSTGGGSGGTGGTGGGTSGGNVPAGTDAAGAATVTPAPSTGTISRDSGGGGTQELKAGALRVVAPKRFALSAKRTRLGLRATLSAPGTVDVSLLKGSKRAVRGTVRATRAGTIGVALRLSTKLKAGRYTLQVTFRPTSGKAVTKKVGITITKAKKRSSARLVGIPLAR